jgi:hypothetical protein
MALWSNPFAKKMCWSAWRSRSICMSKMAMARRNSEHMLQGTLMDIVTDNNPWEQKLLRTAKLLQSHIPFDYLAIGMKNMDSLPYQGRNFLRLGFNEYQMIGFDDLLTIGGIKRQELIKLQEPVAADLVTALSTMMEILQMFAGKNLEKAFVAKTFKTASNLSAFIPVTGHKGYTLSFYSRKNDAYSNRHAALLKRLQIDLGQLIEGILTSSQAIEHARTEQIIASPKSGVKKAEKHGFDGIIGSSHLLLTALDHLTLVAPMDTSVLILGESGTGKERFARSVHGLSARKSKPLVTVNCAALPTHLIESELFGHEKGAFTGAVDRRIGKFEQANGGTIFLDEIGELPLESQSKLLRVLQEKEIERLGGRETLKIDVRVIAATNCNLEKEVAAGKFRLDLYYRLNIFPILLPSLRERKEDIAELAAFFVSKYSERVGKPEMVLAPQALTELDGLSMAGERSRTGASDRKECPARPGYGNRTYQYPNYEGVGGGNGGGE